MRGFLSFPAQPKIKYFAEKFSALENEIKQL
jgi:hypothetical protein